MPFTPAHAAAAIPFRRSRLILSAVVVGCLSPDFEYFLRLGPRGGFGHTIVGLFVFDLPASILVLWFFHAYVKAPILAWLPESIRHRLPSSPTVIVFRNAQQIGLILLSIIIGAATHILWDSFTHPHFWPYYHWHLLRRTIQVPVIGPVPCFKIFQHLSTVVGLVALLLWSVYWYRSTNATTAQKAQHLGNHERLLPALFSFVALVLGLLRGYIGIRIPNNLHNLEAFLAEAITTAMTILWLELVAYGVQKKRRHAPPNGS